MLLGQAAVLQDLAVQDLASVSFTAANQPQSKGHVQVVPVRKSNNENVFIRPRIPTGGSDSTCLGRQSPWPVLLAPLLALQVIPASTAQSMLNTSAARTFVSEYSP